MKTILTIFSSIVVFCSLHIGTTIAEPQTANKEPELNSHLKSIPPDKLKEDLDFLFKTIEEVHPNMYAYISEEQYARVKQEFYKHIDHSMNGSEFWLYVRTAVSCLNDSHTRVFRPSNFIMPQISESMRELGERLKKLVKDDEGSGTNGKYVPAPRKKEYTGPYSYHFFAEHDTCLMVINWFGEPDQVKQYTKAFKATFKVIKEKQINNLVIDVRENRGGCGLVGDELLKYLANKPFRQIEKIEQRLVPEFFELCEQYGLNINQVMADEYGIDLEDLKSRGDHKAGITVTGQVPFKNPHKSSERFKGSVYLLIARPTFSAASNFAAAVKYFEIGTLIGQETSGKKDHYGQILPIQLPNSGLNGQVSTAHFITVGGIEDSNSVKPDYEVKQKPQDTAKGVDTALQFTLNLIKSSEAKK